jgi:S-DNA-T family DNA segregation ATPase FtsK/SpoIIIE
LFNRQPRIQIPIPQVQIKVPPPPNLPQTQGGLNWLTSVLPIGAMLLSVVLMVALLGGSSSMLSYLIFVPIMLATAAGSIIVYFHQQREARRETIQAQETYMVELRDLERRLMDLQQREQEIRRMRDPDLRECSDWARERNPRLGERRPDDEDFLSVRLGTGTTVSGIVIEPPSVNPRPVELTSHFGKIDALVRDYSSVSQVPILASFKTKGSIGVAGPRADTLSIARSIICHLACHHWPTELQFNVICSQPLRNDWRWIEELPHSTARRSVEKRGVAPSDVNAGLLAELEDDLQNREQLYTAFRSVNDTNRQRSAMLPKRIVIVDNFSAVATSPALSVLLKRGFDLGVMGLFLTEAVKDIPGECGGVAEFVYDLQEIRLRYSETGPAGVVKECRADACTPQEAETIARCLGEIAWQRTDDVTQPPGKVTFLDMLGVNSLDELDIENWWDGHSPYGYLCAPIGKTSRDAELVFNLNDSDKAHGPHGLIGGMTGSGKSELLRTIVLALALTHHPYDLNFALVDYKGGATFNDLRALPHTVGVITDIESHSGYGERVIQSLTSEIERRKHIIEEARQTFELPRAHIDDYRNLPVRHPLPRLIIIFDEFAEFKQKHKEESQSLIGIARQGRSLGVHLILATQNPSAAVDEQVRQNSTFRIALHVASPTDSTELVGIPDAAFLNRGQGYFRVQGPQLFQVAYAGEVYRARVLPDDAIVRLLPNGRREVLYPQNWGAPVLDHPAKKEEKIEFKAIIDHIAKMAERFEIPKLPPVWHDPLPERLYLPDLLEDEKERAPEDKKRQSWDGKTWAAQTNPPMPFLGRYDDPAHQDQDDIEFRPHKDGNLLIFGAPGSGKSTLLQTIITNLLLSHSPEQVHVYIADLAGQPVLKVFEDAPHVGAVITRAEGERIDRLLRFLRDQVEQRSALLGAMDLAGYNQSAAPDQQLPVMFIIIDDFGELKRPYADQAHEITALVNAGKRLGMYYIISSYNDNDLYVDLFTNTLKRLTFTQTERSAYNHLVGYVPDAVIRSEFGAQSTPGRGLLREDTPLVFQAALPMKGADTLEQIALLQALVGQMNHAWTGRRPDPIEELGINNLKDLMKESAEQVWSPSPTNRPLAATLGKESQRLSPAHVIMGEDGHLFLVSALNPLMGKTTALYTWTLSLAEQYSPVEVNFLFIDFAKRSLWPLRNLPHCLEYYSRRSQLGDALAKLSGEVKRRREIYQSDLVEIGDGSSTAILGPGLVVVIDNYPDFLSECDENVKRQLVDCLMDGQDLGVYLIATGDLSEFPTDFQDNLMKRMHNQGSGILFSPRDGIDSYKGARLPPGQTLTAFPPGRGYLMKRGQPQLIQVALPCSAADADPLQGAADWVERLRLLALQQKLTASWPAARPSQPVVVPPRR